MKFNYKYLSCRRCDLCITFFHFIPRFFWLFIHPSKRQILLTFPIDHCLASERLRQALVSPGRWSVYTRSKYICNVWMAHDGHSAFRTSEPSPLRFRLRTTHLLSTSKTGPSVTQVSCAYIPVYMTHM